MREPDPEPGHGQNGRHPIPRPKKAAARRAQKQPSSNQTKPRTCTGMGARQWRTSVTHGGATFRGKDVNTRETKQRIKNIVLSDPHAASCCGRDLLVSSSLRGWRLSSIAGQRDCRSRLAPIPKHPLQWYQVLQVSSPGESAFAILQGSRCVKVHRKPMQSILQGNQSLSKSNT